MMQTPNELLPDGLKMDLLWTNASPTSAFAAQTISLDLSKYDFIIICYFYENNGRYCKFEILKKNIYNELLLVYFITTNDYVYRSITSINDNGITFYNGYRNASPTVDDICCIPYQIYGVK